MGSSSFWSAARLAASSDIHLSKRPSGGFEEFSSLISHLSYKSLPKPYNSPWPCQPHRYKFMPKPYNATVISLCQGQITGLLLSGQGFRSSRAKKSIGMKSEA